jgi:hypothetical protein
MVAANGRPAGVTLVAVLTWIQGFLDIVAGVILLFNQNNPAFRVEFGPDNGVLIAGIVTILIGLVIVVVARGLLRGSTTSRWIVTFFMLFSLATAIYVMVAVPAQLVSAAISGILSLVVIGLLWSGKAGRFFGTF